MSMHFPVLYSFRRCPYAMRARLALAESGQQCELREVVLRNKPEAMLQASPKGTVPVLVLPDGSVIAESLDIMLWALRQHDPGHWLDPENETLETMLGLIGQCDDTFKYHLDRYKYPQRYENTQAQTHREAGLEWLQQLESRLSLATYLFGQRPALADLAIMPFVRQFAQTDMNWFASQPIPQVQGWLEAWLASPVFLRIMDKYKPWEEGQAQVRFPG